MNNYRIKNVLIIAMFLIFNSVTAQNQISGVVNYHDNPSNPLPDVTLELYDTDNNIVATSFSNINGEFAFLDIPNGQYSLRSSTSLPVGDINLVDASLILQYLFGWITFNDIEFEAADVNDNGRITFGDYVTIIVNYFMGGNSFPAGDWQFIDINVDLTSRAYADSVDVCGTSTGDVEGVWLPGGRSVDLITENQYITEIDKEEVELEIGSSYNDLISGFNLNLTYPVNLIEITDVKGPDENFHFNIDKNTGMLKVIWLDESQKPGTRFFGETLFRVKVKQTNNSTQNKEGIFSLLEGGMVLDNKSKQIDEISITLPKITTAGNRLELEISSYPNPVMNNLNLKITSPVSNSANIFIYDLSGRLVQQVNNANIYKGTQLINLNVKDLPSGQYLYKVNLQGDKNIRGRFQKAN